ncbi:SurA N-terminal domain-containing protein [Tautonia sociabilis]|uniref:peptidylprolyl isomerase n=1 Tax=Tautonia sociabilis TaxID=2080755 RepID=A0A432MQ99_9BACT|nr:SurA N-terminal domain-containing protein [Tautonia sociabilis]RUL89317.1 parvulin peptidyl-prolyl isomerase [Tautonia sociabilis]
MGELIRAGRLGVPAIAVLILGLAPAGAMQSKPGAPAQENGAAQPLPPLALRAVPANPSDPIAVVNGEVISRQRLADECVARHGLEVLDTLIMRSLIDQAIKTRGISVTAAEIDSEIDRDAARAGIDRENFLRALARERNLSPRQYAEYIAFPGVALRKLAEPSVQVTEEDLERAFEAYFGPKLVVRMIMVDSLAKAKDVWNQVKANPGGFATIARNLSLDKDSAPLGGLLSQPISRYSEPLQVSDAAFAQLVDGDPDDKDPSHKPKDGDFTGPIQVNETAWVIFQRERLEPGQDVDRQDPKLIEQMTASIFEAKLQERMKTVMEDLFLQAAVENHLTGQIKLSGQEQSQAAVKDEEVNRVRMSKPEQEIPPSRAEEKLRAIQQAQDDPAGTGIERPVGAPEPPKLPSRGEQPKESDSPK